MTGGRRFGFVMICPQGSIVKDCTEIPRVVLEGEVVGATDGEVVVGRTGEESCVELVQPVAPTVPMSNSPANAVRARISWF